MSFAPKMAAGVAAVALAAAGFGLAQTDLSPLSATETETQLLVPPAMGCNDWPVALSTGECQSAGTIRYVALSNLQGASQFCVWRKANPGEWTRLKGYATSGQLPERIVTWFGSAIQNQLQAYFAAGGPTFSIQPNTAPNICRTPIPPPNVQGVTAGQTDATVTLTYP